MKLQYPCPAQRSDYVSDRLNHRKQSFTLAASQDSKLGHTSAPFVDWVVQKTSRPERRGWGYEAMLWPPSEMIDVPTLRHFNPHFDPQLHFLDALMSIGTFFLLINCPTSFKIRSNLKILSRKEPCLKIWGVQHTSLPGRKVFDVSPNTPLDGCWIANKPQKMKECSRRCEKTVCNNTSISACGLHQCCG